MQFFRDSETLPEVFPNVVMTIGNFDGVHLGHRMIIRDVVERARKMDGTAALLTFDPPPARVLGKAMVPRITTLEEKKRLVADLGIDLFVCETFTRALAEVAPDVFMRDVLEKRFAPKSILVGYDFCFGQNRSGDARALRAYFELRGCEVFQFDGCKLAPNRSSEEMIISSSAIRGFLREGDVGSARNLLGRPYFVSGRIVPGDSRGKTIGFPTANLSGDFDSMLPHGVYATEMEIDGKRHLGVTNLGRRPTFEGHLPTLETHLIDFDGDLYGRRVKLSFLRHLRAEVKFPNIDELKHQISKDIDLAREFARMAGRGTERA